MEALVVFGALVALALAAPRWGRDSRDLFRSPEHRFARLGYCWRGRPARS